MYFKVKGSNLIDSIKCLVDDNEERLLWSEAWDEHCDKEMRSNRRRSYYVSPKGYVSEKGRKEFKNKTLQLLDYILFIEKDKSYDIHYTQLHRFGLHKLNKNSI